ncbi:MAG: hypothetical protein Q8R92_09590 [Deltaproteobacteria bacterium]|nr:hypothetical protein [Deltaproteobacteria bacterium]
MIGKHSWREIVFLTAGAAACLVLASHPGSIGDGEAVAGSRVKAEKLYNYRILAGGLGTPTDVSMVNQVIPRFSMYSNPTVPLIEVLNRTDLLVTTNNNLSGLPPVPGFPPGAVVRVQRPTFPNSQNPPPDNNGDGLSDNVTIYSENNANFLLGNDPTVITPGNNTVLETQKAGDDVQSGQTVVVGVNGIAESGRCGDDVQLVNVGNATAAATTPIVGPGANGILETNPCTTFFCDDLVGPNGGCALNNICAGPNQQSQSGRAGDDVQALPCVARFLQPTNIVLNGGGLTSQATGNRLLESPVGGDDVPVILSGGDAGTGVGVNFDSDTTACQSPTGVPIAPCDDVQLVAVGTIVANANIAVVGPGLDNILQTPPRSYVRAGTDLDADTAKCQNAAGVPLTTPCDDVQLVDQFTGGLTIDTPIVGPGDDNILQSLPRVINAFTGDRDQASFDGTGIQAGANRTNESGPRENDDVAIVIPSLLSPNVNAPTVSAPIGIEAVVTMYPAVANMVDPVGLPEVSGSVAFLSNGSFSIGSNGDNLPKGDLKLLGVGFATPGPNRLGVISGLEGAAQSVKGLKTGLAGFVYGGFGWTDLSFKRLANPALPPDLKDNVYYATRKDGGIVAISYRRQRVSDVMQPGFIDDPTGLAYVGPARTLCIGLNFQSNANCTASGIPFSCCTGAGAGSCVPGAGLAANCGDQDPPGTAAGRLYVIESNTGRIAKVPLEIMNTTSDFGLCVQTTKVPLNTPPNNESFQGAFCDVLTGLQPSGANCGGGSPSACRTTGVGLPNTRVVANTAGIEFLTPELVSDPVALVALTPFPVPHLGRITTGKNGISETPVAGDDILVVPVGQGFPNGRMIDAALLPPAPMQPPGFFLMTTPLGDDVIIGGGTSPENPQLPGSNPPDTITTGPNGIAETPVCNPAAPGTCTDIQNIPVGRGEPFARSIEAGPNGLLDSVPVGDDTVVDSPTLMVANRGGTVVWMDLNGFDPFTHTGPPRIFDLKLNEITGIGVGDYINGEGWQVLVTTTDFGGAVVSFDPTLNDNSKSLAATLQIFTDLNDTLSTKLDPSQVPIPLPPTTLVTGLTHVAQDFYPGPDQYIGTPDDQHFDNPALLTDPTNISFNALSEPNEISVDGSGGNIYSLGSRSKFSPAGSFSVNTLNTPTDNILNDDPTTDLYNFISGNIQINVGLYPKNNNAIIAGDDLVVQTTACQMPDSTPIPGCDDIQLTLAGDRVFSGIRGMNIYAGANGVAESGLGGDDVQVVAVGQTFSTPDLTSNFVPYKKWTKNVVGVSAGVNGVLETCPQGDDTVGTGTAGIMALCPLVVANVASCPTDYRPLGIGCTVPTAACPANSICTGGNGIVNSGIASDDEQLIAPGTTGLASMASVVAPGKDEFMQTSPGGDDVLDGGVPLQIVIQPGPDEILQTPPAPGDQAVRLTPIGITDLDVFAFSRPIESLETASMPYAFAAINGTGVNSGVVDINGGLTANALDAAVDAVFPNSSSFFGPSMESPTGEIDFTVRDISLTAFIDNTTGIVFGRGVDRNSSLPAVSLLFLDASLAPVNNAFVGSVIIGRQIVQTPGRTYEQDRLLKQLAKLAAKAAKAKK